MKSEISLGRKEYNARDLNSIDDIAEMVEKFYASVSHDDLLGPVFNDIAKVDWAAHIPKITAFWSRILLSVSGYEGTPIRVHARVNAMHPMRKEHFDRWLELFRVTLRQKWEGPNVNRAIAFAENMARAHGKKLMMHRLDDSDIVDDVELPDVSEE